MRLHNAFANAACAVRLCKEKDKTREKMTIKEDVPGYCVKKSQKADECVCHEGGFDRVGMRSSMCAVLEEAMCHQGQRVNEALPWHSTAPADRAVGQV